jgi:hypothetical protein
MRGRAVSAVSDPHPADRSQGLCFRIAHPTHLKDQGIRSGSHRREGLLHGDEAGDEKGLRARNGKNSGCPADAILTRERGEVSSPQ